MILGITTLLIAIAISVVSAYYSVLGLMAIFPGALLPIIIMGATLEAGKVITAVWLHANWKRAETLYKLYLVPAIIFLMVLTSMGVFGFLSKAHSDQSLVSGDVQSKIAIYDEKIKTEKENIEANRKALKQMDEGVDQVLVRSTTETGAERAVAMRKSQQKERTRLQNEISQSQKSISELNDARAPIAAEVRKVEAEVGPIKYIAALMYGDNPDTNLLEKAVRWVIVLIVIVFDPLAIILILAGIKHIEWEREKRSAEYIPQSNNYTVDDLIDEDKHTQTEKITPDEELFPTFKEITPQSNEEPIPCYKCGTPVINAPGIGLFCPNKQCDVADAVSGETIEIAKEPDLTAINAELQAAVAEPDYEAIVDTAQQNQDRQSQDKLDAIVLEHQRELNEKNLELESARQALDLISEKYNTIALENSDTIRHAIEQQDTINRLQNERDRLFLAHGVEMQRADSMAVLVEELAEQLVPPPESAEVEPIEPPAPDATPAEIPVVEEPEITPPMPAYQPRADFGAEFPNSPNKGDMFLRIDFKPNRLFKWNDIKWIEINKSTTDAYLYNDAYLQHLANKLSIGEYSLDELSELEVQQVQRMIGNNRG